MTTFSGKLNLLKFKGACVISVKGHAGVKKGVFIPIDDNHIFISADDANKAKGAYIDFMAFENKQPGKYGDTHGLKQSFGKNIRSGMTEEELKSAPFFGNLRPFESQDAAQTVEAPVAPIVFDEDADLPF